MGWREVRWERMYGNRRPEIEISEPIRASSSGRKQVCQSFTTYDVSGPVFGYIHTDREKIAVRN